MTDSKVFTNVKGNKYLVGLVLAVFALNLTFLILYIFKFYQNDFHSDSAAKVLLAKEIYHTGSFFPKEWNYVNGDIFILFGHAVIAPLLGFMPAGFQVHAISGLISSTLILSGFWLITGFASLHFNYRLLIISVFTGGISVFMAESLFGQGAYGAIICISC